MVARLKLKGIDGRAHKEWSLRLKLTQHGETHGRRMGDEGLLAVFSGFSHSGGAWSFVVRGSVCLVNSDNEREPSFHVRD